MATKITTRVLADNAVTDAKIANVTLTTSTQTASDNTTKIATTAYVTTAIANLADSAPSTLNTLNELAAALGDDANYATTTTNAIAAKAPLANPDFTGQIQASNAASTIHELITTNNNTRSTLNLQSKDSSGNLVSLRMHALGDGPRGEIFTYTNHPLSFATNNAAPQMTLLTNGNVGIGETSPDARLDIRSSGASTYPLLIKSSDDQQLFRFREESDTRGTFYINDASENSKVTLASAGSSSFMGGNVGIGETSPLGKLHVKAQDTGATANSVGNLLVLEGTENGLSILSSTSGAGYILFGDSDDNAHGGILYDQSAGAMRFRTGSTWDQMKILANGDVFVGKTASNVATAGHEFLNYGRAIHTVTASTVHILNRKSNDGDISLYQKDGTTIGSIGIKDGLWRIGQGNVNLKFSNAADAITPANGTGTDNNNAVDLGTSGVRFKDLFLSATANATTFTTAAGGTFTTASGNDLNIVYPSGRSLFIKEAGDTHLSIDNTGDVLIGSTTNLNVLSGTPKIQIGKGDGHSSMQFYSANNAVGALYFGDGTSGAGAVGTNGRYPGYLEYRHSNDEMAFRAGATTALSLNASRLKSYHRIEVGTFPQSQTNAGEAWIGRAADRQDGTLTVQLGGNEAAGTSFEIVDRAWSKVIYHFSGEAPADSLWTGSNGNTQFGYHAYNSTSGISMIGPTGRTFWDTNYNSAGAEILLVNNRTANGVVSLLQYRTNGNVEGSILGNSDGLSISNASDYRKKENIRDLTGSLNVIKSLQPRIYEYREGFGTAGDHVGFIAHEIQDHIPKAVTGNKDDLYTQTDIDEGATEIAIGSPKYQAVAYTHNEIITRLVQAMQEQQTLIESLTARIEALGA